MNLKKEYIFIIINYITLSICWLIFESGISLNGGFWTYLGLLNLLIHTILIIGGECIIYCIFSIKNEIKATLKVISISMIINMFLYVFYSSNYFIVPLSINQIVGVIIAAIIIFYRNRQI